MCNTVKDSNDVLVKVEFDDDKNVSLLNCTIKLNSYLLRGDIDLSNQVSVRDILQAWLCHKCCVCHDADDSSSSHVVGQWETNDSWELLMELGH